MDFKSGCYLTSKLSVMIKKVRKTLSTQRTNIYDSFLSSNLERNVSKQIQRLKRNKKITVVFLVSENEKWGGLGALYSELETRKKFIPIVALTKIKRHSKKDFEVNLNFFKSKGINCRILFDFIKDKPISLLSLKPDVVFYQQPWSLHPNQSPRYCLRHCLTLYLPYSVLVINNPAHYGLEFHRFIWRIFLDSSLTYERFLENSAIWKKCIVSGNPKMEILCETTDDEKGSTGQIIFAPHHSFEEKSLGLATFIWSGFCFLAFAEQNPNIEFIFKPHPRFRYALERNLIFSKDKIEEFYKRLDQASNILICEDGDYGEIFRKSRLLITDCGSFLAEYYVFNKPVVHLISQSSVGLTELGRGLTKNYYAARNEGEFMDLLEMLVIENCDPLLPYRKKQSDIFGLDGGEKPSKKIADFLEKTIWGDVNNLQ